MKKKQNLHFLGLGLDYLLWKRLTEQLVSVFANDEIDPSFKLIRYKWSKFKENSLDEMIDFRPDFIFTSSDLFKTIEEMEFFFQSYQPSDLIDYPSLYLIERKPLKFIKNFSLVHPLFEYHFKQFPKLRIEDTDLFIEQSVSPALTEIQPLPELFFKDQKDIFLDREKLIGFASWKDLSSIEWKGNQYSPQEFKSFFHKSYQKGAEIKKSKGILLDCGRAFIFHGFLLRDISRIKTDFLPIDCIIGRRKLKEMGTDWEIMHSSILETAKYRCSLRINEVHLMNGENLKSKVPVTISSDSSITGMLFKQLMTRDGYQQVETADQVSDFSNRFLISLHSEPVEETPFTYSIIVNHGSITMDSNQDASAIGPLTEIELEDISDSTLIKKRKDRVGKRSEKLENQLKALDSAKVETDKKRYIDMIARNKMEFIHNLLEVSEIWDEHSCDVSVARQENVLVLYEDEAQAKQIDNQLENNNRKSYLRLAKRVADLESLVNLNTGPYESYLHDGVIICCMNVKALLLHRFQQFDEELSQKKYPPLDDAIANLKSDINKCKERSKRLEYLEFASQLNCLYRDNLEKMEDAIVKYSREVERTRYSVGDRNNICIISDNEDRGKSVKSALDLLSGKDKEVTFHTIYQDPGLIEDMISEVNDSDSISAVLDRMDAVNYNRELTDYNVKQLSSFYRSIAKELNLRDVDIFYLAGDPVIFQLLIEFLRQKGSKYLHTPIVMLASGTFNYQNMLELWQNDVKVLYQDHYHYNNPEALSQTFKYLLST